MRTAEYCCGTCTFINHHQRPSSPIHLNMWGRSGTRPTQLGSAALLGMVVNGPRPRARTAQGPSAHAPTAQLDPHAGGVPGLPALSGHSSGPLLLVAVGGGVVVERGVLPSVHPAHGSPRYRRRPDSGLVGAGRRRRSHPARDAAAGALLAVRRSHSPPGCPQLWTLRISPANRDRNRGNGGGRRGGVRRSPPHRHGQVRGGTIVGGPSPQPPRGDRLSGPEV